MSIILIGKKKNVYALDVVNRLATKKIFAPKEMNYEEEAALDNSLYWWSKKLQYSAYEKKELGIIMTCLIESKQGGFDDIKDCIKRYELKYTDLYPDGL